MQSVEIPKEECTTWGQRRALRYGGEPVPASYERRTVHPFRADVYENSTGSLVQRGQAASCGHGY